MCILIFQEKLIPLPSEIQFKHFHLFFAISVAPSILNRFPSSFSSDKASTSLQFTHSSETCSYFFPSYFLNCPVILRVSISIAI